jgi:GDP-L-fucose synthase
VEKEAKIYVAGHRGLVGSAIVRELKRQGYRNLVERTSGELDLRDQSAVEKFFASEKPDYVFLAAAKVGGIVANNSYPADFIYDNLQIQTNVIGNSYKHGVKKLLFLGSSCIYPKYATQPIKEDYLLTGELEPTNESYAIAKIAGIKLCNAFNRQYDTNYLSVMPTNLYGPNDNFDLETSHVLPALIRKFHEAKVQGKREVILWGTGTPLREFLHVDDLARATVFLMQNYNWQDIGDFVNVGTGKDLSIGQLAQIIAEITGFEGTIFFDLTKPDGTPRKLLDISRIRKLGWNPIIDLEKGIEATYKWALLNKTF